MTMMKGASVMAKTGGDETFSGKCDVVGVGLHVASYWYQRDINVRLRLQPTC